MNNTLKTAIENLYITFNTFEINNLEEIGCFDFGPSPEELAGISRPLRDIPENTVRGMEFFAYGWDSWGSKNEAGYFLPRLMEYLAEDIERLEDPGFFSLFKYKLRDLFSDTNNDWNGVQKDSLLDYFKALLKDHLSTDIKIGSLIECVLALDLAPQIILSDWNPEKQTRKKQVAEIFDHFGYDPNQQKLFPAKLYFDDNERILAFLNHFLLLLSPEDITEMD